MYGWKKIGLLTLLFLSSWLLVYLWSCVGNDLELSNEISRRVSCSLQRIEK